MMCLLSEVVSFTDRYMYMLLWNETETECPSSCDSLSNNNFISSSKVVCSKIFLINEIRLLAYGYSETVSFSICAAAAVLPIFHSCTAVQKRTQHVKRSMIELKLTAWIGISASNSCLGWIWLIPSQKFRNWKRPLVSGLEFVSIIAW